MKNAIAKMKIMKEGRIILTSWELYDNIMRPEDGF